MASASPSTGPRCDSGISECGMRIARCTLELGGKSAAVILDDADIETTARTLSG